MDRTKDQDRNYLHLSYPDFITDITIPKMDLQNPEMKGKNMGIQSYVNENDLKIGNKFNDNTKKGARKTKKGWIIYWTGMVLTWVIVLNSYHGDDIENAQSLPPIGLALFILSIATFILSYKTIPGGYSMAKQAICHMGRIRTKKGHKNSVAAGLFFLYGLFSSVLLLLENFIVEKYVVLTGKLRYLPLGIKLTILGAFMTANVPIDINKKLHYFWALLGFGSNVYINTVAYVYILRNALDQWFIILTLTITLLSAAIYMVGFLRRYRYAALFQKIWIFSSVLAFYLVLYYFTVNLSAV